MCIRDRLEKSAHPLSAYQIKERLDADHEKVDTVSIYRILETLEANHLIHRILSTGQVSKCAMCCDHNHHHGDGPHHHLLICKTCNTVSEAPCADMDPVVATVEANSQFKVQTHHLEFWGQCAQCQEISNEN